MGSCQSCKNPEKEIYTTNMEKPGIKSEAVLKLKSTLDDFQNYHVVKLTTYSYIHNAILRQHNVQINKTITSLGTVKPVNLAKLKIVNEELDTLKKILNIDQAMKFKCGLELGDPMPQIKFNILLQQPQQLHLPQNTYTLIKSWGQGEQMVNFEHAIELKDQLIAQVQFQLIGLARNNDENRSTYEEIVRSNNGWQEYKHIYILTEDTDNHILDIYFQEENNDVCEGYIVSALLFYGDQLIWKKYVHEWEQSADSDEVAEAVNQIIKAGTKTYSVQQNIKQQDAITNSEYQKLKQFIKSQQQQQLSYTRNVEVTIQKKTIYGKSEKSVCYQQPIIQIYSSPKSSKLLDKISSELKNPNYIWDKNLLKQALLKKLNDHKLNIECCLEKQIKIYINWEKSTLILPNWEEGNLIPYYKSTQYISQIKQWIQARDEILSVNIQTKDPINNRINEMMHQFFSNIPTVEQVINQQYGKIPYAEKRKPPYEDLSFSKSVGYEEIARKEDKILYLLLIDYENEDTLDMLKQLIQFKKDNNIPLQIAILGHIRAESWTKLFQAFMEKHKLNDDAQNGIIETWFPIEDKIGSISFSAILSKMYGMVLEKKDSMIIGLDNCVKIIDSSRRLIPNISKILTELQMRNELPKKLGDYQQHYNNFKKCIRENTHLNQLVQKIKTQITEDDTVIIYEQKKVKVWDIEEGKIQETNRFQQPTKIIRMAPSTEEVNLLNQTISQYVSDIQQLK